MLVRMVIWFLLSPILREVPLISTQREDIADDEYLYDDEYIPPPTRPASQLLQEFYRLSPKLGTMIVINHLASMLFFLGSILVVIVFFTVSILPTPIAHSIAHPFLPLHDVLIRPDSLLGHRSLRRTTDYSRERYGD